MFHSSWSIASGSRSGACCPCEKRLVLLERRRERWVHGPERAFQGGSPFALICDDREADLPPTVPGWDGVNRWRAGKGDRQLPHEIVEGCSEAMDDVAEDAAPFSGRSLTEDYVANYLTSINVLLGFDSVRLIIAPEAKQFIQFAEISFGAIQPGDEPFRGGRHVVTWSAYERAGEGPADAPDAADGDRPHDPGAQP